MDECALRLRKQELGQRVGEHQKELDESYAAQAATRSPTLPGGAGQAAQAVDMETSDAEDEGQVAELGQAMNFCCSRSLCSFTA